MSAEIGLLHKLGVLIYHKLEKV